MLLASWARSHGTQVAAPHPALFAHAGASTPSALPPCTCIPPERSPARVLSGGAASARSCMLATRDAACAVPTPGKPSQVWHQDGRCGAAARVGYRGGQASRGRPAVCLHPQRQHRCPREPDGAGAGVQHAQRPGGILGDYSGSGTQGLERTAAGIIRPPSPTTTETQRMPLQQDLIGISMCAERDHSWLPHLARLPDGGCRHQDIARTRSGQCSSTHSSSACFDTAQAQIQAHTTPRGTPFKRCAAATSISTCMTNSTAVGHTAVSS